MKCHFQISGDCHDSTTITSGIEEIALECLVNYNFKFNLKVCDSEQVSWADNTETHSN